MRGQCYFIDCIFLEIGNVFIGACLLTGVVPLFLSLVLSQVLSGAGQGAPPHLERTGVPTHSPPPTGYATGGTPLAVTRRTFLFPEYFRRKYTTVN